MNKKQLIILCCIAFDILLLALVIIFPYLYTSSSREFSRVSITEQGYSITGYVSKADQPGGKWVVLVHGNRKDGQQHTLYENIRNNLPTNVSVLAVDLPGFGASSPRGYDFKSGAIYQPEDIALVTDYLEQTFQVDNEDIILIGHSLGAARVMSAAIDNQYDLAIPIGLGDWDGLLNDTAKIRNYLAKYRENTGITLLSEQLVEEGQHYTSQALFNQCPQTPVDLIFAQFDDAKSLLYPIYQDLAGRCGNSLSWSVIPLADHMYGTEVTRLPEPIKSLYSRILLAFLKYRLTEVISTSNLILFVDYHLEDGTNKLLTQISQAEYI